jgi:hypothetical protein
MSEIIILLGKIEEIRGKLYETEDDNDDINLLREEVTLLERAKELIENQIGESLYEISHILYTN